MSDGTVAGTAPPGYKPAVRARGAITMAQQEVDNQAQYPWNTIVFIEATFPDGSVTIGSGVLVGQNDVLTAAHLVYDREDGGAATRVEVTPAFDPDPLERPFGTVAAEAWHFFTDFDPNGDAIILPGDGVGAGRGGTEHDVALLDLGVVLGDETGWMGLDPAFEGGLVNVTGHPGQYGFNMTNETGYVRDDDVDWFTDTSALELHSGNSGGPLWHLGGDGLPYVVGVVSSGAAAHDIAAEYDTIVGWIEGNDGLIAIA
jgi:V8-like Glu-specific endopeptidase